MSYLIREKLRLRDLAGVSDRFPVVLMAGLENTLAVMYARLLETHRIQVHWTENVHQTGRYVDHYRPAALLRAVESGRGFSEAWGHLRELRRDFPALPIISLGFSLSHDEFQQLMGLGIAGHINRRLSRPGDVVEVVKIVLNH